MNTRLQKILKASCVIGIISLIWGASMQTGEKSAESSSIVTDVAMAIISKTGEVNININSLTFIIRKLAHFTEYFILGTAVKGLYSFSIAKTFAFGVTIAMIDETIQLFVPNRNGSIIDVIIDSCGFLVATIIVFTGKKFIGKNKSI